MAELYVQSLSGGKKVWMGVGDGQCDIKPKIEMKTEANVFAGRGATMNDGRSMSMGATDKEETATDAANELVKWKKEAKERETLKDRLLESKDALIAMWKEKYGELEAKLKQKEEALANMEKKSVGVAKLESTVQTDSMETPPTEQMSRAAIAAQKLGVDIEPPNEWQEKCEHMERALENVRNEFSDHRLKYGRMKRLLRAERKTTATLHGKLIEMGIEMKKETLKEPIQLNDDDDDESNEVFTSPLDSVQIEGRKRRQKQQLERMRVGAMAISGGIESVGSGEEQRQNEGGVAIAEKRAKTTAGKSTLGNRTSVAAGRRRIVVGGHRMIVRNKRQLPVRASARGRKQDVAANPISVAIGAFPCTKCPQHLHFASAQLLQEHQQRRHSDHHRFPCDQCGQAFTTLANMNTHKKLIHSSAKPFSCPVCDKCFGKKSDMKKHERVHTGERPYVCTVCQKAFITSGDLRRHERMHSGEKKYCCKYCGTKFAASGNCWQHQKTCSKRAEYVSVRRILMAELYVKSVSSGKKVWMGEKGEECDVKPKIEPKFEVHDQEDHQSPYDDNANQSLNTPISHELDSVSVSGPLVTSLLPTPPALPTVSSVTVERATMHEGDSMAMEVADKDKEKSMTDVSIELLKWKKVAKERDSQLKDRLVELVESKDALIAMMKRNAELEMKLKQKEDAEKTIQMRDSGAVTMESAVQTDSMENAMETLPTEQLSRAARAAQLLGLPVVDVEVPPNAWKEKCKGLERTMEILQNDFNNEHIKYKTAKRLYHAEQKTTAALRGELTEMRKKTNKEPDHLDNADESNEMVISTLDSVQIEEQEQQVMGMRELNATATNDSVQSVVSGEEQQENDGNVVTATGSRTSVTDHHRRHINVSSGRRVIQGNRRLAAVVASAEVKKPDATANPINVAIGAFPCSKCPQHAPFGSAQLLQQHQQYRHSARHRFPCDQCGQLFTQMGNLKVHKKAVHDGVKPFECPFCTKRFSMKANLKQHKHVHTGERPHVCSVCQQTFHNASGLRTHERLHTGVKPYCCKYCGAKFTQAGNCWTHQKICSQGPK